MKGEYKIEKFEKFVKYVNCFKYALKTNKNINVFETFSYKFNFVVIHLDQIYHIPRFHLC